MTAPNIVLVIGDDWGTDMNGSYGIGDDLTMTPAIDALAASGIQFNRFVTSPMCSPTRTSILTGRLPARTGITNITNVPAHNGGYGIPGDDGYGIKSTEVFLGSRLKAIGYNTCHVGKWHIHHVAASNQYDFVRQKGGYDKSYGWPWNLQNGPRGQAALPGSACETFQSYVYNTGVVFNGNNGWPRLVDGTITPGVNTALGSLAFAGPGQTGSSDYCADYITTRHIDDAIDWMENVATPPFFISVGLHPAHFPLQAPPSALYTVGHSSTSGKSRLVLPVGYGGSYGSAGQNVPDGGFFLEVNSTTPGGAPVKPWRSAIMYATDGEVKRLFDSANGIDNTIIIFCCDNGSNDQAGSDGDWIAPVYDPARVKGSCYVGGTRCPLIVAGTGVVSPGRVWGGLVHATDIFRTVLELAGGTGPTGKDSISFKPVIDNLQAGDYRQRRYAITVSHSPIADPDTYTTHVFTRRWYGIENTEGFQLIVRAVDDPGIEFYRVTEPDGDYEDIGNDIDLLTIARGMNTYERTNYELLKTALNGYIHDVERLDPITSWPSN